MYRIKKIWIALLSKRTETRLEFLRVGRPFLDDLRLSVVRDDEKLVPLEDLVGKFHYRLLHVLDGYLKALRIIYENYDLRRARISGEILDLLLDAAFEKIELPRQNAVGLIIGTGRDDT